MEKCVENFLENNDLLKSNNVFVIAFSGGFDSMTLANIFINLSKKYKFKIVLAHLNHNWRAEKSKQEAKICEIFAKENNVDFYTETLPEEIPHTETIAREERYKFFERAAKKYNTDKIFTAHTKSDNIETILQRIIKGTGISGLKGIQDIRKSNDITYYRPLLIFERKDILDYCKKNNLKPNNDNSNKDTKYFRNRIREKLLPDLKDNYNENIEEALSRLIQNAKDSEEIIENLLKKELSKVFDDEIILTKEFIKLSIPIKKRITKELLENNDLDYDQKRILEVLDFIETSASSKSGKTFSLSQNQWLFVNNKIAEIIDKTRYNTINACVELNMEGETFLKEFGATIKVTKWTGEAPTTFPKETENIIFADFSNIDMPLTFRTRQYGDKIVPFGKHTPIKLKKYLNNKKISKHDKSKVLLISSPKEVLWVINMGISNNIKVQNMPTHKVEIFYKEQL